MLDTPEEPYTIEGSQGDRIAGRMTRADAAEVLTAALTSSDAVNKTIEVRRAVDTMQPGSKLSFNAIEKRNLFIRAALGKLYVYVIQL